MKNILDNPVWHALNSGNNHLAQGNDDVKYFDIEVSPFVALRQTNIASLKQLYNLLSDNRTCFLATPVTIDMPAEWKILALVHGVQMVHIGQRLNDEIVHTVTDLSAQHIDKMVALTQLTKPGPFDIRTIEFGHYQGIFSNDKLVAMAGQRMHAYNYAEISAVCTHPNFTGKGYARQLLFNQINRIIASGETPYLHTRADNERAIRLYESLGFSIRSDMYFYILKKQSTSILS